MTIASNKNTPRNTYTATGGQTAFTIGFEFFKVEDVKVYRNGSLLTYNASPSSVSQYKITGTASASDDAYEFGSGGTVTLGAGATADDSIVIIRDIVLERTSDFPTTGAFDITALNTQLDTITSMLSDLKQQSDRSVKLLDTDTVSSTITLPAKTTRQSKMLGFDANGNIETTVSSDGLATLSGIASDISTVASISSDVSTVSSNNANITTLAGLNSQITSLGAISSDISTLATFDSADITTVADNIAKVQTAADDLNEATSEIDTVANSITNVDLVGGSIANVNLVGPSIASVNTVATNMSQVQNFADVYRIASSAPTTSLNQGDLYFDTTANELKVYKSSGWAAAGSTVNGTADRFTYTVSSSTTTITGADDSGSILAYDAGFIDVYLNGVKMVNGSDVTVTSGSSIVFASAIGASGTDTVDVIAFGTFQLANISINDLTDTPAALGSAGQALVVNSGGTALEYANASSAEVYGFKKTFTGSTINRTVTVQSVSGSNKYFIDGVQQDTLELLEGNTYVFSYPSAHPFALSTTANGTHGGGSEYTTGVTRDTSANTLTYIVPTDAPQLYYYCTSHSNMGGTANTPVPRPNTLQVQTTNQGADNITQTEYESFDDVQYAASGFTWSISSGKLIATI